MDDIIPPLKYWPLQRKKVLTAFVDALYKINPSLHRDLSRVERVGVFAWLLGWGIFSSARDINKIKDNIHVLQEQNQLQDRRIKQLAKYLNLTVHQVNRHGGMLYGLDTGMTIVNKTVQQLVWSFDAMRCEMGLLHFFQNGLYRVCASLYALQSGTESLFECMGALASQGLSPVIIPPGVLESILCRIELDMGSHAGLELCGDLEVGVWSYYRTMKLAPNVLEDC